MTQTRIIRWGIAGPGRIANSEAGDFHLVPDAVLAAVGSRSLERAQAFAHQHGIEHSYGSYRELIDDPELDAIYITTPHPQHLAIARGRDHGGQGCAGGEDVHRNGGRRRRTA